MAEGLNNREIAELYERYGHLLLERCQRILKDRALADDALQDTFIRLMRHGAGLRESPPPLGYLYRTAHRSCFDLFSKRSRRAERTLPELPALSHPDPRRLVRRGRRRWRPRRGADATLSAPLRRR